MNNSNPASDHDPNFQRCSRCSKSKHKQEFVKKTKADHVPQEELEPSVLEGVKLVAQCRECRERRDMQGRKSNELRKAQMAEVNNAKLDSYIKLSWEKAQSMIDEGYAICRIKLSSTSRSFEAHHEVLISDFYRHLPEDIPKDNKQAIGRYVADELSRAEGLQFSFNRQYTFGGETPKGRPSVFTHALSLRYTCSQRQRILKPSTLPYGRTRNRRARIELYNCNGTATVIFPAASSKASFDFAVQIDHNVHPGREHLSLPLKIREWIRRNPRPTSTIQREELMRAIARGELPNIQDVYLKPMHIHY
jgi:mRNA-degrading endonuclease toxin of MazEF toxin-antitoxin module